MCLSLWLCRHEDARPASCRQNLFHALVVRSDTSISVNRNFRFTCSHCGGPTPWTIGTPLARKSCFGGNCTQTDLQLLQETRKLDPFPISSCDQDLSCGHHLSGEVATRVLEFVNGRKHQPYSVCCLFAPILTPVQLRPLPPATLVAGPSWCSSRVMLKLLSQVGGRC